MRGMPKSNRTDSNTHLVGIKKSSTGIKGFDEITGGGLPQGRPSLVVGSAGSGKTLFGMEFLIRGAEEFNEPGVFLSFEETSEELAQNVASIGFDVKRLESAGKIVIDHVHIERAEIEETGEYDLEALFVRIGLDIDSINARRIVIDSVEALFSGLSNEMILRSELRRLFRWLKEKSLTAVVTSEQGNGTLTRHGLEEYISDAVILLDHRMEKQLSTRRLRVIKYRGSVHGTNEYPFLIGKDGFEVLPVTSMGLRHLASAKRVSTGVKRLDTMLGGKGYYLGSTVLLCGTAGSGKTSLAAHFVSAACARGEKCLFYSFEESVGQIIRNMRSIGIDLEPWVNKGLLRFSTVRPAMFGLEMHLATMHQAITDFKPRIVVIDSIADLGNLGSELEVKSMLTRLVDFLKLNQITSLLTSLTAGGDNLEQSEVGISSLVDTWLLVRELETNGERNRGLYILKSRGMAHSNQIREFLITDHGVDLVDVYLGPNGFLTGSARLNQVALEAANAERQKEEIDRRKFHLSKKRKQIEAQILALQSELASEEAEFAVSQHESQNSTKRISREREEMSKLRQADNK